MEVARNGMARDHPSNTVLPEIVTHIPEERAEERRAHSRNPERPSVASRNGSGGSSRNNADAAATARETGRDPVGTTAARETAPGAALNGVSGDEGLQTLLNPAPRYPEQARRRGREGTVQVEADVDERGIPAAVRVLRSSGYGILDDAAVKAVGKWRFRPARIAGKSVSGRVVVPIEFRLTTH
jgi:protein TonB